jgi:hypothetical protein
MPGVGFAERYVIARESNVVRVDFARRPDPPAPRFPGASGLRPATWRAAAMDQGEPQAWSASSPLAGKGGMGCSIVLSAPSQFLPRKRKGAWHRPLSFSERVSARPRSDFGGLAFI